MTNFLISSGLMLWFEKFCHDLWGKGKKYILGVILTLIPEIQFNGNHESRGSIRYSRQNTTGPDPLTC